MGEYITSRVTSKVTKAHASGHFDLCHLSFRGFFFLAWNERNSVRFQGFLFRYLCKNLFKNINQHILLQEDHGKVKKLIYFLSYFD